MEFLYLIVFIIIAGVLVSGFLSSSPNNPRRQYFNYRKNNYLFTKAERSFLGVLEQAIDDDYVVYGKVRIGDVLKPENGLDRSEHQTARNKIDRKHFDFVVCRDDDRSIVCAIELNDSSHMGLKQQQRDSFVRTACQSANLPLLEVPAKQVYPIKEVREYVMAAIQKGSGNHHRTGSAPNENTGNALS